MKRAFDMIIFAHRGIYFALAVNLFVIPNDFGEGGVTGISIILFYVLKWSPALVGIVINGILLIVGYKLLDKNDRLYHYRCSLSLPVPALDGELAHRFR